MANTLTPSSAFMHWHPPRTPDLVISARETLTMASLAPIRGQKSALEAAVRSAYGVGLPASPSRAKGDGIAFVWAGPDQWLAVADRQQGRDLECEFTSKFGSLAAIVDQSDARVIVSVSGARAREVLAKGVPLDLHPRAFRAGDAAITHASHIGVILWQTDDTPTYELAMFRSYADSFAHWLFDAAAEFAA